LYNLIKKFYISVTNLIILYFSIIICYTFPQYRIFILKTTPNLKVRNFIWKLLGNSIGENSYLNSDITLLTSPDIKTNIILGNRVALSPNITFITFSSPNDSLLKINEKTKKYCKQGTIQIGDDTWVGTNTTIHPGIKIGKGCIIGAMSNITKNIPDFCLAYGNPVRIIQNITSQSNLYKTK